MGDNRESRLAYWTGHRVLDTRRGAAQAQSWRENYDAGKRLFEQGRYVEADKLMTAALKQAANSSDQYVTSTSSADSPRPG